MVNLKKTFYILAAGFSAFYPLDDSFAVERKFKGYGRLVLNDAFGDFEDRWQSFAFITDLTFGPIDGKAIPSRFGELLDVRLRAEIRAPANLNKPNKNDRPYATTLSLGLHTHQLNYGIETSIGADLNVIGPQTHLSDVQKGFHKLIDAPGPENAFPGQIENQFQITITGEAAYPIKTTTGTLRPFLSAETGTEDILRIGADYVIGNYGNDVPMARDTITGHRYRTTNTKSTDGLSVIAGADYAHVDQSVYLPSPKVELEKTRSRVRLGTHWQHGNIELFYGAAYLSKEFKAQPEAQTVGVLNFSLGF